MRSPLVVGGNLPVGGQGRAVHAWSNHLHYLLQLPPATAITPSDCQRCRCYAMAQNSTTQQHTPATTNRMPGTLPAGLYVCLCCAALLANIAGASRSLPSSQKVSATRLRALTQLDSGVAPGSAIGAHR
ncbi:hypothetical protein HaLaN_32352, partial [Haematococcus lacustris]